MALIGSPSPKQLMIFGLANVEASQNRLELELPKWAIKNKAVLLGFIVVTYAIQFIWDHDPYQGNLATK